MQHFYSHADAEQLLFALAFGATARLFGRAVTRSGRRAWSVDGGEPLLLLPAMDARLGPSLGPRVQERTGRLPVLGDFIHSVGGVPCPSCRLLRASCRRWAAITARSLAKNRAAVLRWTPIKAAADRAVELATSSFTNSPRCWGRQTTVLDPLGDTLDANNISDSPKRHLS
jgi:hypothetical protein